MFTSRPRLLLQRARVIVIASHPPLTWRRAHNLLGLSLDTALSCLIALQCDQAASHLLAKLGVIDIANPTKEATRSGNAPDLKSNMVRLYSRPGSQPHTQFVTPNKLDCATYCDFIYQLYCNAQLSLPTISILYFRLSLMS